MSKLTLLQLLIADLFSTSATFKLFNKRSGKNVFKINSKGKQDEMLVFSSSSFEMASAITIMHDDVIAKVTSLAFTPQFFLS